MPASDKVNLEDYADRKIIALAADRMGIGQMSVGPKGEKRNLSVLGQGGRGFMNIFNGGGWAFSDFKTADKFLKRLRAEADPDGNVIVGITVQSPINHLKNQTGQLAYIEAMQAAIDSKTITKRAADAQVAAMSSAIVQSTAKSIKQSARDKFAEIKSFKDLKKAVTNKQLNFADMEPMLTQMQRKALPITHKELSDIGMTAADIARDLSDPELADVPFGSVVALLGVNVKQAPEKTGIHYSYPWTIHGDAIGYLNKFYNISDLSTEKRIRNAQGVVTAQPLQTVMPVMDNIINTIKTKQGIPSDPSMRFMPSDTDYLSAVQKGDTQAAQRMVDEAAKAAGVVNVGKPLYHGGNKIKTSFAPGATRSGMGLAYLTDKKQVAWKYALGGGINQEMSLADYRRQQLKKLPSREPTVQKLYVVGDVADFSSYQDRPSASQLIEMFGEGKMSNILEDYSSRYRDELDRGDSVESTLQGALEEGGFVREDTDATAGVPELQFLAASGLLDSYLKKIGKNVVAYDDVEAGGKTYVVFDPTQIKSAEPITRDDAGNVIPLSKRFQQTSEDIRYMPSDDEYLTAVKRGNTSAAQDMVDAAAKAAGYTVGPVYHGTPTGGFNVFDKRMRGETSGVSREAFSFTTNQKAAENYSKRLGDEAVRLDAGLRVANDAMRRFDDDMAAQEYFSSKGYTSVEDGMLPEFDWGSIEDVPEFIKELRGYAKDLKPINPDLASSFVEAAKVMSSTKAVPEVKRVFLRIPQNAPVFQATPETLGMVMRDFSAEREPTKSGIVELPGNERIYYVADSSQVKLADPVTKDAQGNVIPLSKRFQASSEDIRFMPQPDSSMPGAYSFQGGYRAIPGKTKGSLRLYGPAGSLIGIAASLDEAQRILRRKSK